MPKQEVFAIQKTYLTILFRPSMAILAREKNHTHGIEGFCLFANHWSYQHRGIFEAYFRLYVKEIEMRFNCTMGTWSSY